MSVYDLPDPAFGAVPTALATFHLYVGGHGGPWSWCSTCHELVLAARPEFATCLKQSRRECGAAYWLDGIDGLADRTLFHDLCRGTYRARYAIDLHNPPGVMGRDDVVVLQNVIGRGFVRRGQLITSGDLGYYLNADRVAVGWIVSALADHTPRGSGKLHHLDEMAHATRSPKLLEHAAYTGMQWIRPRLGHPAKPGARLPKAFRAAIGAVAAAWNWDSDLLESLVHSIRWGLATHDTRMALGLPTTPLTWGTLAEQADREFIGVERKRADLVDLPDVRRRFGLPGHDAVSDAETVWNEIEREAEADPKAGKFLAEEIHRHIPDLSAGSLFVDHPDGERRLRSGVPASDLDGLVCRTDAGTDSSLVRDVARDLAGRPAQVTRTEVERAALEELGRLVSLRGMDPASLLITDEVQELLDDIVDATVDRLENVHGIGIDDGA